MNVPRTLLLSLPWASYHRPSLSIGALAAFSRRAGFEISAQHLHLEAAALFGLEYYDIVAANTIYGAGEALIASVLFPAERERLLKYASRFIANADQRAKDIQRVLRRLFSNIKWSEIDVVGFSANYEQLFASLLFAEWIKRDHPHIITVIGGRLVAGKMGMSLLKCFPQVDYCVDGEGELPLLSMQNQLKQSNRIMEPDVPGLIYRQNGEVKINPQRQIDNLAELPNPDYEHYFSLLSEHPHLKHNYILTFLPVEAGRGCLYRCAFCDDSPFWHGHRSRPAQAIADSIQTLSQAYGTSSVYIVDEMLPPEICGQLFADLKSGERDYRIFCQFRAGMPRENLIAMKNAGVCEVGIGIEALDTTLLKKMNKGTRFIDNLETMKFCEELGIKYNANLIAGFPTETQQDVDRSTEAIEYCIHLRPPAHFGFFLICENSAVYNNPDRYGIYYINDAARWGRLLPVSIHKNINIWYKNFRSRFKKRNYARFTRAHSQWARLYELAKQNGDSLLIYYDCRDFIRIEDKRRNSRSISLTGIASELYRYCDTIKSLNDIKEHFSTCSESRILQLLRQFKRHKLLYSEGDDYLSLAIKRI